MAKLFEAISKYYTLDEYIFFLKLFLEFNQDISIFESILHPYISVNIINSKSKAIDNKVEFYKAIKKEIGMKEEYLPHISLLQDLINKYEMKSSS